MRSLVVLILGVGLVIGQPKPPENKEAPRLLLAIPPGVAAGKETKVILRGIRTDTATGIECLEVSAQIAIVRRGKNAPPNMFKPEQVGDTEVEVKIPPVTGSELKLVVVTPTGKSNPLTVLIDDANVIPEQEPNGGYAGAQSVVLGQTIAGKIQTNQDVDCFRFEGRMGEKVSLEVLAARLGSPLDAVLTLSEETGKIVAQGDDLPDSRDARLEVELPRTGSFIVTVQDAHDLGTTLHGYRLLLRRK